MGLGEKEREIDLPYKNKNVGRIKERWVEINEDERKRREGDDEEEWRGR